MKYQINDVLRVAKRYNNAKRVYLLVDPLQAKHMPISPTEAMDMMSVLGDKLAKNYPSAGLIVGFAETATAIASVVAEFFPDCQYVQSTREEFPDSERFLLFSEEHSHAVEQKLHAPTLERAFLRAEEVILLDDEISTGKTLINMVEQIRREVPGAENKRYISASIINRATEENISKLLAAGIESEQTFKLDFGDYDEIASRFNITPPTPAGSLEDVECNFVSKIVDFTKDPRLGVSIREYSEECRSIAHNAADELSCLLAESRSVLVLGSEECMYPALVLGKEIEGRYPHVPVRCHATTRSPIGVSCEEGYPIVNGYEIHSLYDTERRNFIYNVAQYDTVIILSDAKDPNAVAVEELRRIFAHAGCKNFVLLNKG